MTTGNSGKANNELRDTGKLKKLGVEVQSQVMVCGSGARLHVLITVARTHRHVSLLLKTGSKRSRAESTAAHRLCD